MGILPKVLDTVIIQPCLRHYSHTAVPEARFSSTRGTSLQVTHICRKSDVSQNSYSRLTILLHDLGSILDRQGSSE